MRQNRLRLADLAMTEEGWLKEGAKYLLDRIRRLHERIETGHAIFNHRRHAPRAGCPEEACLAAPVIVQCTEIGLCLIRNGANLGTA